MLGRKQTALSALRVLLGCVLFGAAGFLAIPSVPSHEPVTISLPSALIVGFLVFAGLCALPNERLPRLIGFGVLALTVSFSIYTITQGIVSGFWAGDVTLEEPKF